MSTKLVTKKEEFEKLRQDAIKAHEEYNLFESIVDDFEINNSTSPLHGVPYVLKDNISTKGILTTGSSNILNDYIPVFDATIYKKLKEAGAVLLGKVSLDELAMGGTGTTGHLGPVKNPLDISRITGGSSSGSAAAVASGLVPFAIGSDTGDSIRKPAAYCGIVGFKPTYGRISRWGVFAFASSLDTVGIMSKNVYDCAQVTNILKGQDEYDATSLPNDNLDYTKTLNDDIKGKKLLYFKNICNPHNYDNEETKEVLNNFCKTIVKCQSLGLIIDEIEFPEDLLQAIYPVYQVISCAEATSNNANLTGIPFGNTKIGKTNDEIMFNTRTAGFGELIKRRFIIGSYVLQRENQEKLFLNAKRARRLIVDKINELFKNYDGIILPASGKIAPKIEDISNNLAKDAVILENYLAFGNFGGYPSITIPSGKVFDMPVGINITGPIFNDKEVLNIAYKIEECLKEVK